MPPELNQDGDPIPTSPLSDESVTALLDQLLSVLEADSRNCEIFASIFSVINGYSGTRFAAIAGRKLQSAMAIHQHDNNIFNHAPGCPMYVDAAKLFKNLPDATNN